MNIPLGPLPGAGSAAYSSAPGEASDIDDASGAEPPLRGRQRLRLCGCWAAMLLPLLAVPAAVVFGLTTGAGADWSPGPNATRVNLGVVDADAVCNDGTEAGYYFAPATDPAKKTTWLIWLQGGGNCHDGIPTLRKPSYIVAHPKLSLPKKKERVRQTQTRDWGEGQGPHLHEQDFGLSLPKAPRFSFRTAALTWRSRPALLFCLPDLLGVLCTSQAQ